MANKTHEVFDKRRQRHLWVLCTTWSCDEEVARLVAAGDGTVDDYVVQTTQDMVAHEVFHEGLGRCSHGRALPNSEFELGRILGITPEEVRTIIERNPRDPVLQGWEIRPVTGLCGL